MSSDETRASWRRSAAAIEIGISSIAAAVNAQYALQCAKRPYSSVKSNGIVDSVIAETRRER
jgi:hypothetical protein